MRVRSFALAFLFALRFACTIASAQAQHPLDVELGGKPWGGQSMVVPGKLAPAVLESKSLKNLISRASDFAFIAFHAKPRNTPGLGVGFAAWDDPHEELRNLNQQQLFRLGLAVGLDDPAQLDRWRQAVLTGSSKEKPNARTIMLNNDLRPSLIAGVTRAKAIDLVAQPHSIDGELKQGNAGALHSNQAFSQFVWQACEKDLAHQESHSQAAHAQGKPQAPVEDSLAEIDAYLFEELANLPILPSAAAGKKPVVDRRQLRVTIARRILSSLDP